MSGAAGPAAAAVASNGRMPLSLAVLSGHLRSSPVTRFAPAPTGLLHVGHVVNAIHAWGIARALGGRVLLRVEDHDRQRCRPEHESALLDDLDWLGFVPDVFPTGAFRAGRCDGRQSDREAVYRAAIDGLRAAGLVYGCACTRRDIDAASGDGDTAGELRYPGTCRDRGLPLDDAHGWRIRLPDDTVSFDDAAHGPSTQTPSAQCGDLLARDRLGNWTYQFAVTVDDHAQGINLVVRGDDLFASTGRQILLARLLGRETPPVFLHHGLVMKSPTQKLSKSDGDTGVRGLRAAGWTAARVIGHAAHAFGLIGERRDVQATEAASLFSTR